MLNSRKIMKIMLTLNFETPLTQNLDPQSNSFSPHCYTIFGKSPKHNDVTQKLNVHGGGTFKALPPPGSYWVNNHLI